MTEWSGPLTIRPARVDDAKEIARIYNQGVQDRAATFENAYVTPEERYLWLAARPGQFPGAGGGSETHADGVGRPEPLQPPAKLRRHGGTFHLYRAQPARARRGAGTHQGHAESAREKGFYKLVGRIIAENEGARKICDLTGWKEVGVYEKHGRLGN